MTRPCPHCPRPIVGVRRDAAAAVFDEKSAAIGVRRMLRNPDRSGTIEHDDGTECAVVDVDPWLGG